MPRTATAAVKTTTATKVYVNTEPVTSPTGGSSSGKYVIIEVNTDYILSAANLSYTTAMLAGARQVLAVRVAAERQG